MNRSGFFSYLLSKIGMSPSGKAQDFDSCSRGFESRHPSHTNQAVSLLYLIHQLSWQSTCLLSRVSGVRASDGSPRRRTLALQVSFFLVLRVMHASPRRGIELARRKSGVRRELWRQKEHVQNIQCTIEIAQIFTGRTTDIDDIIVNVAGALIGYLIAYCFTDAFTRRIVKNAKLSDFYIVCASVAFIMFFFQPFISSLLWEVVL